jgi:hypothetical protein
LPGQKLTVAVEPNYDQVKASVEVKRRIFDINTCLILLQAFYFGDGTRSSPQQFQKPDPHVAGKYLNITANEFRSTLPTN